MKLYRVSYSRSIDSEEYLASQAKILSLAVRAAEAQLATLEGSEYIEIMRLKRQLARQAEQYHALERSKYAIHRIDLFQARIEDYLAKRDAHARFHGVTASDCEAGDIEMVAHTTAPPTRSTAAGQTLNSLRTQIRKETRELGRLCDQAYRLEKHLTAEQINDQRRAFQEFYISLETHIEKDAELRPRPSRRSMVWIALYNAILSSGMLFATGRFLTMVWAQDRLGEFSPTFNQTSNASDASSYEAYAINVEIARVNLSIAINQSAFWAFLGMSAIGALELWKRHSSNLVSRLAKSTTPVGIGVLVHTLLSLLLPDWHSKTPVVISSVALSGIALALAPPDVGPIKRRISAHSAYKSSLRARLFSAIKTAVVVSGAPYAANAALILAEQNSRAELSLLTQRSATALAFLLGAALGFNRNNMPLAYHCLTALVAASKLVFVAPYSLMAPFALTPIPDSILATAFFFWSIIALIGLPVALCPLIYGDHLPQAAQRHPQELKHPKACLLFQKHTAQPLVLKEQTPTK